MFWSLGPNCMCQSSYIIMYFHKVFIHKGCIGTFILANTLMHSPFSLYLLNEFLVLLHELMFEWDGILCMKPLYFQKYLKLVQSSKEIASQINTVDILQHIWHPNYLPDCQKYVCVCVSVSNSGFQVNFSKMDTVLQCVSYLLFLWHTGIPYKCWLEFQLLHILSSSLLMY